MILWAFLIITVVLFALAYVSDRWVDKTLSAMIFAFGFVTFVVTLIIAFCAISNNDAENEKTIHENYIKYQGLCRELELLEANDPEISKTDVMRDIIEWNDYVVEYKEGAESKWTYILYSQEVAENLQTIDF